MTNLHERMLPNVRIQHETVRIPVGRASDRATAVDHLHQKIKSTSPSTMNILLATNLAYLGKVTKVRQMTSTGAFP